MSIAFLILFVIFYYFLFVFVFVIRMAKAEIKVRRTEVFTLQRSFELPYPESFRLLCQWAAPADQEARLSGIHPKLFVSRFLRMMFRGYILLAISNSCYQGKLFCFPCEFERAGGYCSTLLTFRSSLRLNAESYVTSGL